MATTPNMPVGTASIAWVDGGGNSHLRVYSTDGYTVTERQWDINAWTTGSFSAPGAQVSATCYQTGGGVSIRVYCNFEDVTTEYCSDAGGAWYQGGYTTS